MGEYLFAGRGIALRVCRKRPGARQHHRADSNADLVTVRMCDS